MYSIEYKWGVPSEKKSPPPRDTTFRSVRLARTSQGATNHKQGCSLRLAMLTCGACADEIVLQEGIRQPGHACKSPLHAPLQYLHSAMMCDAVWHLLVAIVMCMAIDTSICGAASR